MHSCITSTNATWNRFVTALIITATIRYVEPQLQSTTFANTLWQVSKQIIKNDELAIAREHIIKRTFFSEYVQTKTGLLEVLKMLP